MKIKTLSIMLSLVLAFLFAGNLFAETEMDKLLKALKNMPQRPQRGGDDSTNQGLRQLNAPRSSGNATGTKPCGKQESLPLKLLMQLQDSFFGESEPKVQHINDKPKGKKLFQTPNRYYNISFKFPIYNDSNGSHDCSSFLKVENHEYGNDYVVKVVPKKGKTIDGFVACMAGAVNKVIKTKKYTSLGDSPLDTGNIPVKKDGKIRFASSGPDAQDIGGAFTDDRLEKVKNECTFLEPISPQAKFNVAMTAKTYNEKVRNAEVSIIKAGINACIQDGENHDILRKFIKRGEALDKNIKTPDLMSFFTNAKEIAYKAALVELVEEVDKAKADGGGIDKVKFDNFEKEIVDEIIQRLFILRDKIRRTDNSKEKEQLKDERDMLKKVARKIAKSRLLGDSFKKHLEKEGEFDLSERLLKLKVDIKGSLKCSYKKNCIRSNVGTEVKIAARKYRKKVAKELMPRYETSIGERTGMSKRFKKCIRNNLLTEAKYLKKIKKDAEKVKRKIQNRCNSLNMLNQQTTSSMMTQSNQFACMKYQKKQEKKFKKKVKRFLLLKKKILKRVIKCRKLKKEYAKLEDAAKEDLLDDDDFDDLDNDLAFDGIEDALDFDDLDTYGARGLDRDDDDETDFSATFNYGSNMNGYGGNQAGLSMGYGGNNMSMGYNNTNQYNGYGGGYGGYTSPYGMPSQYYGFPTSYWGQGAGYSGQTGWGGNPGFFQGGGIYGGGYNPMSNPQYNYGSSMNMPFQTQGPSYMGNGYYPQ